MMANSLWRHCHRPRRRKAGGCHREAAEQRQLYELLLEMEWLSPALRRVIMAELNLSPRHCLLRLPPTFVWRRKLMEAWATFCCTPPTVATEVVPLRKGAST
jgi:hypothetical protein